MRASLVITLLAMFVSISFGEEPLPHSLWLEAETFGPLHGANFSFQPVDRTTKGSWSLSGPGVAPEWTQGGESEFLSVAARADEPGEVVIGRDTEIPAAGTYSLWVRYADYRGKKQSFGVRIKQGDKTFAHVFGEKHVVDDLDPMKLIWDWAFGWDHVPVDLKKGTAHIELYTTGPCESRRQVDCLCLTTDTMYHPTGREKPDCATWQLLRAMRESGMTPVESIRAKNVPAAGDRWQLPAAWKSPSHPPAFLWNTAQPWLDELKKKGDHVEWPFNIDGSLQKQFIADFHDKDLPVFGDPLSGPAIHIPIYPAALGPESALPGWFDRHPDRPFAILLNYGTPAWPKKGDDKAAVYENVKKLGDRFIGFVVGESLSYGPLDAKSFNEKIRAATSRAQVLEAFHDIHSDGVIKGMTNIYGKDVSSQQAWEKLIPCMSSANEAFAHAVMVWGSKRVGHEGTGNSPTLARRLAFLRGAARQFGAGFVDYQSCNLGDASTIFSRESQMYPGNARYILDNSYDAWAGCGMNWVLKDYLLFHVAGADAFYHEEGQDIFWKPGGNSAGDGFPIGLSPRGRVTDAVINIARSHPRGSQYTPVAFLLDEAHGWSQESFQPGAFGLDPTLNPAVLSQGSHEANIRGWFDVAYFPAPQTQNEPSSAIRQTYVNGIFGDIFDVIVTAPKHTDIARTYPVLIASGEVTLSQEWGTALKSYVEAGGTLVVCNGQFRGPGAADLELPKLGNEAEASSIDWMPTNQAIACNAFRFHSIDPAGGQVLATAGAKPVAVAIDRGRGRLIYVGIPMGLGIDQRPVPILALLMRHLTTALLPIRAAGDIEWTVNRLDDGGWLVTLLNNRGVIKPQHGVLPTDYHEAQTVHLIADFQIAASREWVAGQSVTWNATLAGSTADMIVPAGMVRMIEIHGKK